MPVTPTSPLALVCDQLRTTVSDSSTFQTRTGAANAAAALAFIHYGVVTDDTGLTNQRPLAIVQIVGIGSSAVSDGIGIDLSVTGELSLVFQDDANHQTDHNDSLLDFVNFCDGVMDDLRLASGVGDSFPIQHERMIVMPERTMRRKRDSDNNDYWEASYLIGWNEGEEN